MSEYFDAYRIDHILGFFRIWEIPAEEKSGMMGHFNPSLPYKKSEIEAMGLPIKGLFLKDPRHRGAYVPRITPRSEGLDGVLADRFGALYNDFFYHRHEDFWRRNAEKKLPELLSACGMLACGEDLGMVPHCVPGVMDHWKILSLEMACMEKGRPWPYYSVCATSSHDLGTLRMQNNGCLSGYDAERILGDHMRSASMLSIHPLQDYLAMDENLRRSDWENERVNDPANPEHHWRYRLHLPLESLMAPSAESLRFRLLDLIRSTIR